MRWFVIFNMCFLYSFAEKWRLAGPHMRCAGANRKSFKNLKSCHECFSIICLTMSLRPSPPSSRSRNHQNIQQSHSKVSDLPFFVFGVLNLKCNFFDVQCKVSTNLALLLSCSVKPKNFCDMKKVKKKKFVESKLNWWCEQLSEEMKEWTFLYILVRDNKIT